jgi:hypothetical protein
MSICRFVDAGLSISGPKALDQLKYEYEQQRTRRVRNCIRDIRCPTWNPNLMDFVGDAIENRETKRCEESHLLQAGYFVLKEERAIGESAQNAERRCMCKLITLWNVNSGKSVL